MPHPDLCPAQPVIEGEHVDDHVRYTMPVIFTSKKHREGIVTVRHYENGTYTLSFDGIAVHELERRDQRGPIEKP